MNNIISELEFEVAELKNEVAELRRSVERMRIIPGAGVVTSESEGGTVVELDSAEVFFTEYMRDFSVRVELDENGNKVLAVRNLEQPYIAGTIMVLNGAFDVPVRIFEPRTMTILLRVHVEGGRVIGLIINNFERDADSYNPYNADFTTIASVSLQTNGEISIRQFWRNGARYIDYRWWL